MLQQKLIHCSAAAAAAAAAVQGVLMYLLDCDDQLAFADGAVRGSSSSSSSNSSQASTCCHSS
jgi:hypothetical protein